MPGASRNARQILHIPMGLMSSRLMLANWE
jgi:hypothetical protein